MPLRDMPWLWHWSRATTIVLWVLAVEALVMVLFVAYLLAAMWWNR